MYNPTEQQITDFMQQAGIIPVDDDRFIFEDCLFKGADARTAAAAFLRTNPDRIWVFFCDNYWRKGGCEA